jgi:hypothetical protein
MLPIPFPGLIASDRASFKRAHASNELPKLDAETESADKARRYALAEDTRSVYADCESSRSDFVSTACAGCGLGGRGRLKALGIGRDVEA